LRREVALLDQELALTTVRAPAAGMVLTPQVEELVGSSLAEGDQMLALGRTDTLELEMGVDQRDILRVRPGQEVRLRVGRLAAADLRRRGQLGGPAAGRHRDEVRYPVRALIPNPDGLLRPEMVAHARILTDPASTATRLLRGPWRWLRLTGGDSGHENGYSCWVSSPGAAGPRTRRGRRSKRPRALPIRDAWWSRTP
jgi:multidrug efflux pump subunit AcrA (membrane-fusion protein)